MRLWAGAGPGVVVAFAVFAGLALSKPKPHVSFQCEARHDEGSCQIENKGGVSADVDVNVVAACRDGEHLAHVSARVDAYGKVTKIIEGFEPGVGLLTTCPGIDFRDVLVRETT